MHMPCFEFNVKNFRHGKLQLMTFTPNLEKITQIIETAGQTILVPYFQKQNKQHIKGDGSIVTEADVMCQAYLQEQLNTLAPDISFLGEEMSQQTQLQCLQSEASFWCVDPLDGTSNFATPMPLFGISIALIQAGKPVLACIYDPIRKEMFTAIRGQGLQLNGQAALPHKATNLSEAVGFLDFKRLSEPLSIAFASQSIYRSQRNLGTCALEWAWLAAGRAQFIVHGGEKLWDYAAGSLLAQESGCVVTDFAGRSPFNGQHLSSSILAAPAIIHSELLAHLHAHNT